MPSLSCKRMGTGAPLVLVHGYLGGSAMWTGQIARFSPSRDVICPDLAGFGDSAALTAPDSIGAHAHDVLALLDRMSVREFDLLGHSMGGMVAQEMVRLAPGRIRKLVLYGTGPQGAMPGRFETIAQSRSGLLRDGIAATARRIAATWFLHGEQAAAFGLCHALGLQVSLQTALSSLLAWQGWDGRAALKAIQSPMLVIWGSHDRSYDWSQPETLWRSIPGGVSGSRSASRAQCSSGKTAYLRCAAGRFPKGIAGCLRVPLPAMGTYPSWLSRQRHPVSRPKTTSIRLQLAVGSGVDGFDCARIGLSCF